MGVNYIFDSPVRQQDKENIVLNTSNFETSYPTIFIQTKNELKEHHYNFSVPGVVFICNS
jgi:hypothetical protein